jgi:hypothetical protein
MPMTDTTSPPLLESLMPEIIVAARRVPSLPQVSGPVRVVATAAVFGLSVRSLTRNAQPTRPYRIAVKSALAIETVSAVAVSRMDRRLVAGAVPLRPEQSPVWHTPAHVVLRCDVDDFSRRPMARLVHVGKGEGRMVVNRAFLSAAAPDQSALYNAAIDVPARTRHLPLSATANTVGILTSVVVRRALVGERDALTMRRAIAVLTIGQVIHVARRHVTNTLVNATEPPYARA